MSLLSLLPEPRQQQQHGRNLHTLLLIPCHPFLYHSEAFQNCGPVLLPVLPHHACSLAPIYSVVDLQSSKSTENFALHILCISEE